MTAYILNLLDLAFTLYALQHGGVELNPLMQCVPIMVVYKTIVVGALCWWLKKHRARAAKLGLQLCSVIYGALCLYHLVGLFLIR